MTGAHGASQLHPVCRKGWVRKAVGISGCGYFFTFFGEGMLHMWLSTHALGWVAKGGGQDHKLREVTAKSPHFGNCPTRGGGGGGAASIEPPVGVQGVSDTQQHHAKDEK